jgi:hypothetical protein
VEAVGIDPHADLQILDSGRKPQPELKHDVLLFKVACVTE